MSSLFVSSAGFELPRDGTAVGNWQGIIFYEEIFTQATPNFQNIRLKYTTERKRSIHCKGIEVMKHIKGHLFSFLYAVLLIGFTIYILLDAFVIQRRYVIVEDTESSSSSSAADESSSAAASNAATITENRYQDEHIQIVLTQYREWDTDIYVADITLSSADYLKTAFADNAYGKNITQKTSEIAQAHQAVLAINGDYYSARSGYVLRNGTLYRDSSANSAQQDLVIGANDEFSIITEGTVSASALAAQGVRQILSFGPALVENSCVAVSENTEVDKAMRSNPRTAIASMGELHYLMVVSDGRTAKSEGISLYQLAEFLQRLGAQTAYNLDGGGSSTMYFNGQIINNPTTNGKQISERRVSDIVYIG